MFASIGAACPNRDMSGFERAARRRRRVVMRASHTLIAVASSLTLLLGAATASAHFTLVSPPTPAGSKDGKGNPPCGPDTADGVVTTVMGGAPLMLNIKETVRHGGFYRVALAL